MMLAFATAMSFSIVDLIDKHLIDKYVRNPYAILCISGIVSLFFGVGTLALYFQSISYYTLFLCFCIAISNLIAVAAYLKAFQSEEVSRVVPVLQTSAIFVVLISFFFLGEMLLSTQYLGIALITLGAILISMRKRFSFNKGAVFALLAAFMSAINFILFSITEASVSYLVVFGYTRIFYFFLVIPLFFLLKNDLKESYRRGKNKFLFGATFAEALNSLSVFFLAWAFSLGSASLVSAVLSTEPFIVIVFATLLTWFFPQLIKEEADKGTLIYKIIAIVMIFAGVWLIG